MKKQSQNGSMFVIILSAIAVIIFAVLGYLFYANFMHKESQNTSTNIDKSKSNAPSSSSESYDLTTAVGEINKTLSKQACNNSGLKEGLNVASFTVVSDSDAFVYQGGKNYINQAYSYAYTQYGCGSQGSVALLERANGAWALVSEDARIYPMCDKVKSHSFPKSILDKCYLNDSATEPTAL